MAGLSSVIPANFASNAIRHFGESAILVRRSAGTTNAWDEHVPGAETTESITCASKAVEERRDEEGGGSRLFLGRIFYVPTTSRTKIRPLSDDSDGDIIRYRGIDYRVSDIADYSAAGYVRAEAWQDQ